MISALQGIASVDEPQETAARGLGVEKVMLR
jgi:hypothetical protein